MNKLRLYNTLSRRAEDFEPIDPNAVKLYTCGPTVYHYAHIGNLRNVIFNDTLKRTLEICDFKVKHVMNITDVGHLVSDADAGEDKLEKGASRENKTVWEVADYYIEAFIRHVSLLNVIPPTLTIRATSAIPAQIDMVQILIDKEYAYITAQAIYFDVSKLNDYGKLTGQKLSDKEVGVRSEVITDSEKRNPQDFALWFFTVGHFKDHQMHWKSPWGEGFPGWHLECSAIIHDNLGEPIDIHTGGVDHIGTHHTNELAQSEAAFDKPLANYWLHHEFLQQNGRKMSKSGDETITLDDVIERGYDPLALRLFYLQSHYRSEANFSWENLDSAQNRLANFRAMSDLRYQPNIAATAFTINFFEKVVGLIKSDMCSDMNTPTALVILNETMPYIENYTKGINPANIDDFIYLLKFLDHIFGLDLLDSSDIEHLQKQLISEREIARTKKDWAKSDILRTELEDQGIGLKDTEYGALWYRL